MPQILAEYEGRFGKLKHYVEWMRSRQGVNILVMVLVIAAIPLTVFMAQRQQEIRQRAAEQPATPPTPTSTSSFSRVFVTSTTYTGNLGGVTGADVKCQDRANAANLGGTWKAWLSDATTYPGTRFTKFNGPYKRLDGAVVANNWNDLIDGTLQNPISISELNSPITSQVWTNTEIYGSIKRYGNPNYSCLNWQTNSLDRLYSATTGFSEASDAKWTDIPNVALSCDVNLSLYCFEQVSNAPSSTPSPAVVPLSSSPSLVTSGLGSTSVSYNIPQATILTWIGFYKVGDTDQQWRDWMHTSTCTKYPNNTIKVSGNCSFPIPPNLDYKYQYEIRAFVGDGYNKISTSNPISIVQPTGTISVSQSSINSGGTITATYNIVGPYSKNWIGIYKQGEVDKAYKDWYYTTTCTKSEPKTIKATGFCTLTIPASYGTGNFEMRMFRNEYDKFGSSNAFTVNP